MRAIVIVEDSEEDFAAIQRVFRRAPTDVQLVWYRDGEEVMKVLANVGRGMSTGHDTPECCCWTSIFPASMAGKFWRGSNAMWSSSLYPW